MKKQYLIIICAATLALAGLACQISSPGVSIGISGVRGSGIEIEEERQVSGITRVRVANQGDLFIEIGAEESLVIEAEDNLPEYIESDVRGGELVLETRHGVNLRNDQPICYQLVVPELEGISVSSSGDVEAPELEAGRFRISLSSSGEVEVDAIAAKRLDVNISSSGDVTIGELQADSLDVNISSSDSLTILDGEVEEQDISISSSGDYGGRDLESQRAEVRLSSSGNATIRVSDELDANLSSSGDLKYIGDPSLNVRTTSSGDVIQLSDCVWHSSTIYKQAIPELLGWPEFNGRSTCLDKGVPGCPLLVVLAILCSIPGKHADQEKS